MRKPGDPVPRWGGDYSLIGREIGARVRLVQQDEHLILICIRPGFAWRVTPPTQHYSKRASLKWELPARDHRRLAQFFNHFNADNCDQEPRDIPQ